MCFRVFKKRKHSLDLEAVSYSRYLFTKSDLIRISREDNVDELIINTIRCRKSHIISNVGLQ